MFVCWLVSLLALALGASGHGVSSECPAPDGFFADAQQCDKYYHCVDNVLTEKLCPDGMAFADINPSIEKCDLLATIDCTDRPELQPAKPTEVCQRQNGNYAPLEPNCQQAYRCQDGIGVLITCPVGLAFALHTGICDWPDQSGREDCVVEKTSNFSCPKVRMEIAVSHPRYADPEDCQYFYVCINGQTPRRNGCTFGQVFSTNTTTCTSPQEVPECHDYYTEYFNEYFANLEVNPGKADTKIIAAAIAAGYEVPRSRDRVRIQPVVRKPPPTEAPRRAERPATRGSRPSRPGGERPNRRRPGQQGGLRRRKRPRTTTTTTTAAPEYYDDYYYYDETYDELLPISDGDSTVAATDDSPVATVSSAAADPSPTSATRNSLPIRPPLLSRTTV